MRYRLSPDDDDFGFFDDEEEEAFDDSEEQYDEEDFEEEEQQESFDEEPTADLPEIDDRAFGSAEDFPDAIAEDFADDPGDWSLDDYAASAANLFGGNPFFGDTLFSQLADAGYRFFESPQFLANFDNLAPGTGETLRLFERDGVLHAFGYLPVAALELLRSRYTGIDWSHAQVSVPALDGERVEPRPLPPPYADVPLRDAVDLRPYGPPVADQRQTARCSAFAWTHATEMARTILGAPTVRLSPNYTMLQFQRLQGDARDFVHAYRGGDGTVSGPEPGEVLAEAGTCQQRLWPDDSPEPVAGHGFLASDAANHRLPATPWPIALDDVKRALSTGCPVHVSMNTGPRFADVGRDGVVDAAEAPSGIHGRHAMLLCGYMGNFYIGKNSWGPEWGDQGYCYIPKNVLMEAEADFVAALLDKPGQRP